MRKIKLVKVYQSVTFCNSAETSFTPTEYHSANMTFQRRPKCKIEETEKGVLISAENEHPEKRDCILVTWANIAFIQYDSEAPVTKVSKAK